MRDTKISLELYLKRYFQYPASLDRTFLVMANTGAGFGGSDDGYASFGIDRLVSRGSGEAHGVELFVQKKLSAIIIEVMKDVEEFARFRIPKFLRAFLDILYFHARQAGITGVITELPNVELWLELGVSVQTQLSLMELGLSRTSAIEVFE